MFFVLGLLRCNCFGRVELWNCVCLINRRIISVKIGLFMHEITFITEFPGSIFLLPTFLTGGEWNFQGGGGANLLLLISKPAHEGVPTH